MRHEGEPSVEEILQSIKKVIARDNREAQQAERRRRERAGIVLTPDKPTEILPMPGSGSWIAPMRKPSAMPMPMEM